MIDIKKILQKADKEWQQRIKESNYLFEIIDMPDKGIPPSKRKRKCLVIFPWNRQRIFKKSQFLRIKEFGLSDWILTEIIIEDHVIEKYEKL
jgi:hypothetical protein